MPNEPESPVTPVCPYCNTDPIAITVRQLEYPNGLVLLIAACGNVECRKVLSGSFMGMHEPRIVPGNILRPS